MISSIFNDVIGPVMRGPSSSHVAGGLRIAELVRQSLMDRPVRVTVDFDVNGALAASHDGHGTDMGFTCGLLGKSLEDPDIDQYEQLARDAGLDIEYRVMDYGALHPGNYRIEAEDELGTVRYWQAKALGGGMIKLWSFEDKPVSIYGDYYELLVVPAEEIAEDKEGIQALAKWIMAVTGKPDKHTEQYELIHMSFAEPVTEASIAELLGDEMVADLVYLKPVLPTRSRSGMTVPFRTAEELLAYAEEHPLEPWQYGVIYECNRGKLKPEDAIMQMEKLYDVMEGSIETGLAGTHYEDRILGQQSDKIRNASADRLIPLGPVNEVISDITAVMETKSSLGLIVAAPTCGSCGCLPGTLIGLGRTLGKSKIDMVKALFIGSLVGIFFSEEATLAAEVGGCQVECGAASGMAAAAVCGLMGGSITECMDAASIALQNVTGLACDPVGNRVEVPCLGKNIMAGTNALSAANMALAGYDKVIPLDETIQAIYEIGLSLPLELRCTYGGLGVTPTAKRILQEQK